MTDRINAGAGSQATCPRVVESFTAKLAPSSRDGGPRTPLGTPPRQYLACHCGKDPATREIDLRFGRRLDDREWQAWLRARSLLRSVGQEAPYESLWATYREFLALWNDLHSTLDDRSRGMDQASEWHRKLEKAVGEWLSSFRSFVDHTRTGLARRYGRDSAQVTEFDEAVVATFNDYLGYRLAYKLRNYAQHCGAVLHPFQWNVEESPEGTTVQTVDVGLDRNQLLADFDGWGAIVRADLERLPRYIRIDRVLSRGMESCNALFSRVLLMQRDELLAAAALVDDLRRDVRVDGGTAVTARFVDYSSGQMDLTITTIPTGEPVRTAIALADRLLA